MCMTRLPALAGLMAICVAASAASALTLDGATTLTVGTHTYQRINEFSTWTDAEAFAVSVGGHLVTIDDAAENALIYAQVAGAWGNEDYWIGLTAPTGDVTDQANYVWASGSSSSFRAWRSGQPDGSVDPVNGDRYVVINFAANGAFWDNYPNAGFPDGQTRGIVEFVASVPEPPAALLLCGVAGALTWARRRRRTAQG